MQQFPREMDIFSRIFQIVRSSLNRGEEADWEPTGWPFKNDGTDPTFKHERQVDPQLAGYYANLEIPYGSDLEIVRRAWKRQLKKYHPDLHAENPERRKLANELTVELTRAYQEIERALTQKEKR